MIVLVTVEQSISSSTSTMPETEKFNWKLSIRANVLVLRLVGLWPQEDEVYGPNLYTVYAIFSTVIVMGSHNVFQVISIFYAYDNLETLTQTIVITITDLLASVKMYLFMKKIKLLKELMITLNSDLFQHRNPEQVELVLPSLTFWKTTYSVFFAMASTSVLSWLVLPFVDQSFKQHKLPFVAWYPYDTQISPWYEITYFYQAVCVLYFGVTIVNMDMMIAALMMFVGTQCEILCHDLKTLQNCPYVEKGNKYSFSQKFVSCVKHHRQLIRYEAAKF